MVIDTSALLAILHDEPERRAFNEAIEAADTRAMSMANFVEASIVIESRYGAEGIRDLDLFIERAAIELVDVTLAQGHAARITGMCSTSCGPSKNSTGRPSACRRVANSM